jgi:hypothetical protein
MSFEASQRFTSDHHAGLSRRLRPLSSSLARRVGLPFIRPFSSELPEVEPIQAMR